MISAAFNSLKSSFSLPNFDFSLFKPDIKEQLPYISGDIIEHLPPDKKEILDKLLDNLSIEDFTKFLLNALENIRLGKLANPIHPFNTFEFFLSTEDRIEKTKNIYHKTGMQIGFEHFKNQSIQGFCCFLKDRFDKKELLSNLEEFCKKTHKDIKLLQPLIEKENFKEFVEEILVNF